jgi:hypothetical protein
MQQQQQQPEEPASVESAAELAVTANLTRPRSFHRRTPSLTSSHQTTDISKHYAINNQILAAFQSLYTNTQQGTGSPTQHVQHYQVAYAMGLQFVETALLEIPKHGYYYSTRHETDRMQSALEAVRVTQLLQEMQDRDASDNASDNTNNNNNKGDRVQKLATLALEQVEQASHDQYESHRAETEDCLRNSVHDSWSVCTNPLTACDSLSSMLFGSSGGGVTDTTVDTAVAFPMNNVPAVPKGSILGKATTRDLLLDDDDDDYMNHSVSTIPTLPLKRASFMSLSEEMALEKALYLSGLEAVMTDSVLDLDMEEYQQEQPQQEQQQQRMQPSPTPARRQSTRIELQVLARLYAEDFDSLVQSRRVRVSFINTYQGRLPASTNGCTVIAPVLCMHHLLNDDDIDMDMDNGGVNSNDNDTIQSNGHGHSLRPDPGLPDVTIIHVIDAETPAILSELRQQLRLSPAAFLIPSDVHDYLIGNGQLAQEQFVTVAGGNILDDEHLQSFVDILACTEKGSEKRSADNRKSESKDDDNTNGSGNSNQIDPRRKLAATLFFHEHVVAILKMRRDDDTVWYDVIDSLPSRETLARPDESESDFRHRLSLRNSISQEDSSTIDDAFIPKTARIRCLNAEALKACLRWYACSKFGEENVSYIDMYAWDDSQSDFDPRVFQAFVWGDAREASKIKDTKTSNNTRGDEDRFAEF